MLRISSSGPAREGWQWQFRFDKPYCVYFGSHPSSWRLVLADALLERIKSVPPVVLTVDDQPPAKLDTADLSRQLVTMQIPAGMGIHTWKLTLAR